MVGESSNDVLRPQQLLERARNYHHRESLPPEEYEALMQMGAELINPSTYHAQCFILGSYNTEEKQRLKYVKREINNWSEIDCHAYLMEDFADGLHPMVQFQLIADHSDHIIAVCEHDQGGFQLELGMLLALTKYQDRTRLLKRTYPDEEERQKYNWMLGAGAFELFEFKDNLSEWEDVQEFKVEVANIITDVLD